MHLRLVHQTKLSVEIRITDRKLWRSGSSGAARYVTIVILQFFSKPFISSDTEQGENMKHNPKWINWLFAQAQAV